MPNKRKSPPLPQQPPDHDSRYELLAEGHGHPPRPLSNKRRTNSNNDNDDGQSNYPPRTGPNTPEGKANSARNALKHGLTQNIAKLDLSNYVVLRDECQEDYDQMLAELRAELQPWCTTSKFLIEQIAISRWQIRSAQHRLQAALDAGEDYITASTKFERMTASISRRLNRDEKRFEQLRTTYTDYDADHATELPKPPQYGPDGKPYEVDREYLICKYSNNPSPRHYISCFATEKIIMSDGESWFARTIPLTELMDGEFMKLEYGLGDHFVEKYYEFGATHKIYHPGDPTVTRKWPPPVPPDTPPDEEFLDEELSCAEDPLEILRQREEEKRRKEEKDKGREEDDDN
jgi:hypothetical protein